MPKFTFICDQSCDLDTHVVTHEFSAETYWEAIEQFEMFLKGAGYSFDGILDIVEPIDMTLEELNTVAKHSAHYFDKDRN